MIDFDVLEHIGSVLSNFDGIVDKEIEQKLKTEKNVWADYAGWNFYAKVIYKDNQFIAEIKQFGSIVDYIKSNTMDEMYHNVSSEYGYE